MHWYARGNFLARRGEWAASLEDFRKVLELHPPGTWLEDDTLIALQAAVVSLEAGDREGHRRLARDMLGRFAESKIPIVNERTAKVNLCCSPPAEDLSRLTELADRAVRLGQGHELGGYRSYLLVRGMAAYRSGDFTAAARWIGKAENLARAPVNLMLRWPSIGWDTSRRPARDWRWPARHSSE